MLRGIIQPTEAAEADRVAMDGGTRSHLSYLFDYILMWHSRTTEVTRRHQ